MIQTQPLQLRPMAGRIAVTLLLSAAAILAAGAIAAPIWIVGVAGTLPWLPLVAEMVRTTWRAAGAWLAFYLVLAVTQTGHVGEHVVQIVQLRLLGLTGEHAHGIFGALDIEWVHFIWNSWVLVAVVVLLVGRPENRWLWVTAPLAAWHLFEHTFLIATYLLTGVEGNPGLLAMGGLLGNGLPLARADLHLLYNVLETIPLLIGLGYAWRHAAGTSQARWSEAG